MNPKLLQVYRDRLKATGEAGRHLLWMLDQIPIFKDPEKQHRWLGFARGACWVCKFFTVDEMREHIRLRQQPQFPPVCAEAKAVWISVNTIAAGGGPLGGH
jgi:hypothetical protein